jgi:hypothetical protein
MSTPESKSTKPDKEEYNEEKDDLNEKIQIEAGSVDNSKLTTRYGTIPKI